MNSIDIGKFISALRKEKGYTQISLAEMLNVSNRTVSKWENGDGYPDITLLPEIARVLGVTVDELLNAEKSPKEEEKKNTEHESDKARYYSKICFIFSFFFGIFGAVLGVGNKVYCTWAFRILYYTHWEIIFDAVSLVALVLSCLTFFLGVFEANHKLDSKAFISYCKSDMKKSLISLALWVAFPFAFVVRIFALRYPGIDTMLLIGAFCVIYAAGNVALYKKYSF